MWESPTRVCNLLLLLLASAVPLGLKSRGTQGHILLSQFLRLFQPGRPGPRIYIPQEQGGPDIPPGTGFPFCRFLLLAGLRWRYSNPPPHGRLRKVWKQLFLNVSRATFPFLAFLFMFLRDTFAVVIVT
jgi:hypothetical protein